MYFYTYPQKTNVYPQFNKQIFIFKIHKTNLYQPASIIHLSTLPTTSTTN